MTETARTGTPQWLLQREPGLCPCGCIGKRTKGSYLEKTLRGGAGLLRQVMFSDELAGRAGPVQRIDARVKVVALLGMLVAVAFVHRPLVLVAAYLVVLGIAAWAGLPTGFFVKRVWLFVPIFSGIVVLPATLSLVTPGHVVLPLWHWHGQPEGFTAQGLTSAALVVLRVAVSVSLVVLVTLTTAWPKLLAGLRGIGVPRMFVLVVGMAYRYLFHLLTSVLEMYEARKARSAGRVSHDRAARSFVAASAGAVLSKSHHLAEEVHQAMVARGFRGEVRTTDVPRFGVLEAGCLLFVAVVAALLLGGDAFLVH